MHQVTESWLRSHATSGMGFTNNQSYAITGGRPYKGWLQASLGKPITSEQKEMYEQSGRMAIKAKRVQQIEDTKPEKFILSAKQIRKQERKSRRKAQRLAKKNGKPKTHLQSLPPVPRDGFDRKDWKKQSEAFYKSDECNQIR